MTDTWGTPVEIERRRRINVSVWACAYELFSHSLVDDATFDRESALINPTVVTGNKLLDAFFRTDFQPHTGMWVRQHPELRRLMDVTRSLLPVDQVKAPS